MVIATQSSLRHVALLETSALNHLFRPTSKQSFDPEIARTALRAAALSGSFRAVTTGWLLTELAAAHLSKPARARETLSLLQELSGGVIIRDSTERTRYEIQRRGLASPDELRVPRATRTWKALIKGFKASTINAERLRLSRARAKFYRDARERARARLGGKGVATPAAREWHAKHEANAADWCLDYMRDERSTLGLPRDESLWPHPREVPSLWASYSFGLARVYLELIGSLTSDDGTHGDYKMYADACYADVLVTDDEKTLCPIVDAIAPPKIAVESLEVFLKRFMP